ncbi:MAG TPA: outer membrane protein assembly factor BamC [Gammaproteobacteria bacterium]|nr:outer membrane protein assembly factor BamC [Gammaproteobacteria bacterium]
MFKRLVVLPLLFAALAGCSRLTSKLDAVIPDNRTEYRKSRTLPDLEVPPDLTTDAIRDRMAIPQGGEEATFSTYQERIAKRKREEELERSANDAIKVLDDEHILAVAGAPKQIWPQLRDFMAQSNYKLELDDEELGVIETVWDENPDALTRDKFKIFAEAGQEAGTTLLYVSQRAESLTPEGDDMVWKPTQRDSVQEREFVERLQAFLVGGRVPAQKPEEQTVEEAYGAAAAADTGSVAAADDAASATDEVAADDGDDGIASLVGAGSDKVYLAIRREFADAWRATAPALERAGYTIDQSDKSRGIFYLRVPASEGETQKRGVLSKLKFWGGDDEHELQLNLTGVGSKTEAVVLDREGRWETGDIARKILEKLEHELENGGA